MSIKTEIDRIITAVSAAHEKVAEKGGTTAQPYLVGNLADAIDTIPVGAELPALTNPGKASDALSGKEFIDGSGNKVTGTIATKTASNLTASGATVTAPAGYYASQATKSVATATQATPSIEVSSDGLITAKATQSAGYVAAGTKSATKQLTTQGEQTITPSTSSQTAVAKNVYTTGTVTVAEIPSKYQDITTPLADLNAANGGTAATTMAGAVDNTEAHASSQEALIAQIASALEGKAAGGGSGGAGVETCTVVVDATNAQNFNIATTSVIDGSIKSQFEMVTESKTIDNCVKGSILWSNYHLIPSENAVDIRGNSVYYGVFYQINGDCTVTAPRPCFVRDTEIFLADGTTKHVQDITYDDELLVWNFDNGCYASAKPLWIKKAQTSDYYYLCKFDNGAELKLVGSDGRCHRVFSLDRNMFESATECVGERIATKDSVARLVSCERVEESVEFYNIITEKHLNLFAEGVLTSCRLNNIYPIVDMMFVKDDRDIIPYECFNDIDIEFYNGLRLGEQSMDIADLTAYVQRLNILKEVI